MTIRRPATFAALRFLAGLALISQSGCMSALTTASLRDVLLDTVDSLTDARVRDADVAASVATDAAEEESTPIAEPARPLSLDEAVDRAVSRLNGVGELDAATQATLLSILENTNPQDWPAAIDAFTASLEVHRPPRPIAAPTPPPVVPVAAVEIQPAESLVFPERDAPIQAEASKPTVVVERIEPSDGPANGASDAPGAPLAFPAPRAEPAKIAFVAAARPVGPEPEMVAEPLGAEDPLVLEPESIASPQPALETSPPTPPTFAVRNACFVTRVRAWGVVDRFPEATFRPGQDVIAYFELDAPTARPSAAGHTTSIDTLFRLVSADGRQIGQWDFEPIDETCHAPRRDYFARYFLRVPETAPPGPCRLEFVVTDLVTGNSTQAHLDLEVR